ncbi:hypothetical protein Acr_08g0001880 [Actinidia rufa]|uniref:ARM repeat superfamily protein n=1 Tax=Actinidia rufa TaxID=165716 RepID=A0A7J0EZD2_9ERIC|nr:hypothetical protein Acr_08g0001880 [Actinidia rufa]
MAFGDEAIRRMIVREGGIRELVRVLDPKSAFPTKAREMALRAIVNLCFSSMSDLNVLMCHGFMDHLLYFIRRGEVLVQELALKVAFQLCGISEEAKKAMGDAGFMPELVKLLDAKSFEARKMAAETLSSMVLVPRNRKTLRAESKPCARKKIVHSGYLKNIEKLAEAEVSDAKKLVRKLSSNRFRNMLSGIWHF